MANSKFTQQSASEKARCSVNATNIDQAWRFVMEHQCKQTQAFFQ
jgi:hypothetical protein